MEAMQTVLDTVKHEETRLTNVELKLRSLSNIEDKMTALNSTVFILQKQQDENTQAKNFIERSVPMLIHLQLCEGLEIISGEYQD